VRTLTLHAPVDYQAKLVGEYLLQGKYPRMSLVSWRGEAVAAFLMSRQHEGRGMHLFVTLKYSHWYKFLSI